MTPEDLRFCLETLGWSQRELARRLNMDEARVHKMARAALPILPELVTWIRLHNIPSSTGRTATPRDGATPHPRSDRPR